MFDYQAIAALAAIIETQSFQGAAEKLFITQSAVSQRVKGLEKYYGEPVLIRSIPYHPTALGLILLGHLKQVQLLENSLQTSLKKEAQFPHISLAINRDSLETWFPSVLNQAERLLPIYIEIIANDQEITLDYLKKGMVSACASTEAKALSGCQVDFLGFMDYVLVASPEFKQQYFKNKKDFVTNLITAPAAIFDSNDFLHENYLQKCFGIGKVKTNYHMIPSVAGFKQFALKGYAYALIPKIDILQELKQKQLINLCPAKVWEMPLYWHSWTIESKIYQNFNTIVIETAKKLLRQTDKTPVNT